MKYVKYIGTQFNDYFTPERVYEVINQNRLTPSGLISLINDKGIYMEVFFYNAYNIPLFEDVTIEIRNETIYEILL